MHPLTYSHHNQRITAPLKTQNQIEPRRRDSFRCRAIFEAVREWENTLPGQAQEKIAQLVAEQWGERGRSRNICKQTEPVPVSEKRD